MFNYIYRFALSLPIVLGLVGITFGQQPCYTRQPQQRYTQYVQPQVYQYAQNYQYIPQTISYPVVIGVPLSDLGINYYFSVTPEKRESRIIEQVTKELLTRMNQNGYGILVPLQPESQPAESINPVQPPSPGEVQQPSTQPNPVQTNQQKPPVANGQGGLSPKDQSHLQVLTLMQKKCMVCHKPGEIKKGIKLFNSDGSLFDNDMDKRIDVMNSVLRKEGATAMPPKQSLTPDEKKLILTWIQEKI